MTTEIPPGAEEQPPDERPPDRPEKAPELSPEELPAEAEEAPSEDDERGQEWGFLAKVYPPEVLAELTPGRP